MTPRGNRRSKNLAKRSITGTIWVLGARFLARFSDIILLMVLARFLAPDDFGLIALATSVTAIISTVVALPIDVPLINVKAVRLVFFHTAFSLAVLRAAIIIISACIAAPIAARAFEDDRLVPIILALSASISARSFMSPRMTLLARRIQLKPSFMIDLSGKIAGMLCAVIFVSFFPNHWALVVSPAVWSITSVVASYIVAPYRPKLDFSEWRHFSSYLAWMFPAQILAAIASQADKLILGALIPMGQLGQYNVASQISNIAEVTVRRSISSSLMPSFNSLLEQADRLRRGYFLADSAIFMIGLPIYMLLSAFSNVIVLLALSPAWANTAPFLQGLALAMIPTLFRIPFRSLAFAMKRADLVFWLGVVNFAIRILAILTGYRFGGALGVVYGIGLGNIFIAGVSTLFVQWLIKADPKEQVMAIMRPLAGLTTMAPVAYYGANVAAKAESLLATTLLAGSFSILAILTYGTTILLSWRLAARPAGIEMRFIEMIARARKSEGAAR